jgi:hypothetical protein
MGEITMDKEVIEYMKYNNADFYNISKIASNIRK